MYYKCQIDLQNGQSFSVSGVTDEPIDVNVQTAFAVVISQIKDIARTCQVHYDKASVTNRVGKKLVSRAAVHYSRSRTGTNNVWNKKRKGGKHICTNCSSGR